MQLGIEHVDTIRVNVLPRGALQPEAADRQLSEDQATAVDEADPAVAQWLEESPQRAAALLEDPVAALQQALPDGPSDALVEVLDGHLDHAPAGLREGMGDWTAAFVPAVPTPGPRDEPRLSRTKRSQAGRDVTYMLGMGPLADAFHTVTGQRLHDEFAAGPLPLELPDVNLPGGVALEATPVTTRPDVERVEDTVRAGLVLRVRLHVGQETLSFGDLAMIIGLRAVSTSLEEGLSVGVVPEPDEVTFGTLTGGADPSDVRVAGVDVDLGDPFAELDDLLDRIDDDVEVPAAVEELLTSATPAEIRAAAAEVLASRVLPLLRLEADIPSGELVCDLGIGAVDLGFVPGDGSLEDALAIGLNFAAAGESAPSVDPPLQSVVPHGRDGWVEVSDQLLLRIACCLMPSTFHGLQPHPTPPTGSSCRWEDEVIRDAEGTAWDLHHLEVTVAGGIELDAELSRSWPGVRATAAVRLGLQLASDGSGLEVVDLEVDVSIDLEWWAVITVAIVAAALTLVLGGLGWAVGVGGAIIGIALLFEAALNLFGAVDKPDVLDDLQRPLRLLPTQVTDVFGTPTPERVVWDDLEAVARITPPGETPQVVVPGVVGTERDDAEEAVDDASLHPVVRQVFSDQAHGTVVAQRPQAGTRRDEGSRVTLEVSRGPSPVEENPREVPDVVGLREEAARTALTQVGFKVGAGGFAHSDRPHGEVVAQRPGAGTRVLPGAEVRLTVSRGPANGGGSGGGGGRGGGSGGSGNDKHPPVVTP